MNDAEQHSASTSSSTAWHVEQYGYLLNKLHAMKEGERSVLDG